MDYAHTKTDELIAELEKKIKKKYSLALKAIEESLKKNEKILVIEDAKKKATLTKSQYKQWKLGKIALNKRLKDVEEEISTELEKAHLKAILLAQEYMGDAFALNVNYMGYDMAQKSTIDFAFSVYDKETVEMLINDNPRLLPITIGEKQKKFAEWSREKVSHAVKQGILQGEDIRHIAKGLRDVCQMAQGSSIRNARTVMTAAENKGRQKGLEKVSKAGLKVRKQWLAVHDMRTRHAHRVLDGQIVDIDKPFKVDGYNLEEPGDPTAPGYLVYNCRCTMVGVLAGFEKSMKELPLNLALNNMTYEEWVDSKPKYTKKKGAKK